MDATPALRASFERLGPTDVGFRAMTTLAKNAATGQIDLNGNWGGAAVEKVTINRVAKGGAWLTLEAKDTDWYVRFVPTGTAAGCTATNGTLIAQGAKEEFWIESKNPIVDAIDVGNGTLKAYFSSRNIDGGAI